MVWSSPRACRAITKSQVSRLFEEIDDKVKALLDRSIEGEWPYLWIELPSSLRWADGRREVLGMEIGTSEAEAIWTEFLRKLTRRCLRGVMLVVSDAHEDIKAAVSKVLPATWQGCRVHFVRNALAHAGKNGRRVGGAVFAPASCSRSTPIICSSINRCFSVRPSFERPDSSHGGNSQWQVTPVI